MKLRQTSLVSLLLGFLTWQGCNFIGGPSSDHTAGGGSGSETTVVTGQVVDTLSRPVIGARVILRATDYLPVSTTPGSLMGSHEALTDSVGRFVLDSVAGGTYTTEIRVANGDVALRRFQSDPAQKKMDLPLMVTKPGGSIQGTLRFPIGTDSAGLIRIYGLDRVWRTNLDGSFRLEGLAEGNYTLHSNCQTNCSPHDVYGISVLSKDTVQLPIIDMATVDDGDYATWAHEKTLTVRTGPLGAGLLEGLSDFPLVVRLDSTNFSFATAAPDGSDLRFSATDGTHLDFEIEYWSASLGRAMIWVSMDSLQAGNDQQALHVHWGRPGALSRSNGARVFDSLSGYRGVWHFQPKGGNLATFLSDASSMGNGGILQNGPVDWDSTSSPITQAIRLSGTRFVTTSKPMAAPDTLSLSLWFRTLTTQGGKLIGFHTNPTGDAGDYDRHIWMDNAGLIHFGTWQWLPRGADGNPIFWTVASSGALNDGNWHNVVAGMTLSGLNLYIDGLLMAHVEGALHPYRYTGYWRIGQGSLKAWNPEPASPYFDGDLDEVRVFLGVQSPSWVRMSYLNKLGDRKILIKKSAF